MQASPTRRLIFTTLSYVILTGLLVLVLIPFVWMLLTALKPDNEVLSNPPTWIPSTIMWSNFQRAFTFFPFDRFLLNTTVMAGGATILQIVTGVLAAYAFARLRFKGRDALFLLYLGTLMIPPQVTIVPLFLMMRALDWVDTFWALILPSAFSAFGVFLLRQFFLGIPRELEEAAFIDGAGYFRILAQVILPLSRPALATLGVFSIIGQWNSFLWPLIVTSSPDMRVVSVGLSLFQGQYATQWNLMMAASAITLLPVLLVFAFAQRQFIQGVALTGMGGR